MRLLCSLLAGLVAALAGNIGWANGGHFKIEDAGIPPAGTCGVESWVSRKDSMNFATVEPFCNVTGNSEWRLSLEHNMRADQWTHVGLGYKTVWLDTGRGPALAFGAGARYDRWASDMDSYYVNIPASFQILENITLHGNVGAEHDRAISDTYATWGLAATVKTVNGPNLILETAQDDRSEPIYAAGARFRVGSTRWTLDLGAAHETGPKETVLTIGLNIPSFF